MIKFGSEKQAAKLFLVLTLFLAIFAIIVGTVFYSTEEGGPAKYIGGAAFFAFIIFLVFWHRLRRRKLGQKVASGKRYIANTGILLAFTPIYLVTVAALFYSIIGYGVGAAVFIVLMLPLGPASAVLLALNKTKKAVLCGGTYLLVSWLIILLSWWRSGSL